MVLRPDQYARDCDDCRLMWYDDDGKPITRNGKHLPRPCPPACHRCEKQRLGIVQLTEENVALFHLHTDARLGLLLVEDLSLGERLALQQIELTIRRAERMSLAGYIAEATHGRA
jgi:hypothetical protein